MRAKRSTASRQLRIINKKVIEGALSLFDLKEKTVESQYGYYGDEWIKLSLRKYIQ